MVTETVDLRRGVEYRRGNNDTLLMSHGASFLCHIGARSDLVELKAKMAAFIPNNPFLA